MVKLTSCILVLQLWPILDVSPSIVLGTGKGNVFQNAMILRLEPSYTREFFFIARVEVFACLTLVKVNFASPSRNGIGGLIRLATLLYLSYYDSCIGARVSCLIVDCQNAIRSPEQNSGLVIYPTSSNSGSEAGLTLTFCPSVTQ
ncbi:hypothetical protein BKA93DRAFT_754321 [Sparassis latifolia]